MAFDDLAARAIADSTRLIHELEACKRERDALRAALAAQTAPVLEPSELRAAAQAVVERWDTPLWKNVPHTANYIHKLSAALAAQPPQEPPKDQPAGAEARKGVLEEAARVVETLISTDTDWDTSYWNQAIERAAGYIRDAKVKPAASPEAGQEGAAK